MATWYIVHRGMEVLKETFDTREEAELMALAMTAANGELWHTKMVFGWG